MGRKQTKITDGSLPDRISDLPNSIIDCILDRLPIRDAVATSVLSYEWMHKWRRIGNLVFDKEFVDDVIFRRTQGEPAMMKHEYCNIIGNILLLHLGPIHKFVLHIPRFGNSLPLDFPGSWMFFISQSKVKELTIEVRHSQIRLPSYIFHCNELQYLKIRTRTLGLHPPRGFKGFCNLLSLDLFGFLDGAEISDLVSKCPLLERLSLYRVTLKHPLVIDAHRLRFLHTYCSKTLLTLKNVPSVTAISLRFGKQDKVVFSDLINTFASVPKVETVTLRHLHTIMGLPEDALTSLPTTFLNLNSLTLLKIALHSQQCILFILCILKSSPNLRKLNLGICQSATSEDKAALHIVDMQSENPRTLNNLLTIKMKGLMGSKVEIMFIKLILSCSPILETMYLTGKNILKEAEFTFMSELLECKRRSLQAQVMYSRHPRDSSIFDF
ncbi:unnamed protein product [Rhodiola kirilowii]